MKRLVMSISLLLICSCKREARSFHVPPSSAATLNDVTYQGDLQPAPTNSITQSATQPVDLVSRLNEPYATEFLNNGQALSDGQSLYEAFNCVGCHSHGGGGMGPPLMDRKWFYGADPRSVYLSILQGRPNGMPSFRGRIPDYQIWEMVAYVRSMSGQANTDAASGREENMRTTLPPNSTPQVTPITVPEPTTGPIGNNK